MKLWLYGNSRVTTLVDTAVARMLDSSRGNATEALQEAIVEMRRDIQLLPWQRLKANDVQHLYLRVSAQRANDQ
jgi:uncharacterized protein YggE